ncbi:hypothetical protein MPTK2_3g16810 [Marchantia polymorpha subsp. ruderalis]
MRKTGVSALAIILSVALLNNLQMVRAVGPVCLTTEGKFAPYADAKTEIQKLEKNPEQCCNNVPERRCGIIGNRLEAALYMCGGQWCMACSDAGKYLRKALDHCKADGLIQASYVLPGTDRTLYIQKVGTI